MSIAKKINGQIVSITGDASIPMATSNTKGIVQPDNSTITINNGILSALSSGYQGNEWVEIDRYNFPYTYHDLTIDDDISYGGGYGYIKHTVSLTDAIYNEILYIPSNISSGWGSDYADDAYNGLPNEFYLEVDQPSLVYLPPSFISVVIRNRTETVPDSTYYWWNPVKDFYIKGLRMYTDGKKVDIDMTGDAIDTLPPKVYYAAKRSSPTDSISSTYVNKEVSFNSGVCNLTNSAGSADRTYSESFTTDTNIQMYNETSTSNIRYNGSGIQYNYPSIGNENLTNPIFINRSLLIRFRISGTINKPRQGNTSATSCTNTFTFLGTRLHGFIYKLNQ